MTLCFCARNGTLRKFEGKYSHLSLIRSDGNQGISAPRSAVAAYVQNKFQPFVRKGGFFAIFQ